MAMFMVISWGNEVLKSYWNGAFSSKKLEKSKYHILNILEMVIIYTVYIYIYINTLYIYIYTYTECYIISCPICTVIITP